MRRAVWSERLGHDVLESRRVRRLLTERGLELYVAVTPEGLDGIARVVRVHEDDGTPLALWPMLSRADGRWPNADNAGRFEAFVTELIGRLDAPRSFRAIAFDLEPPIDALPGLIHLRRRAFAARLRRPSGRGAAQLRRLRGRLEAQGLEVFAAVLPLVLSDGADEGWGRFLGTPVDALGVRRVSAMVYTSMVRGYSRGRIRRPDAVALLHAWAKRARARYAEPSLSLGCVGPGVLGNEPIFEAPAELAADVATARAAGIDDLILYSLGGALERPPAEAWLDALLDTEPGRTPPFSWRASAALTAAAGASRLLARFRR